MESTGIVRKADDLGRIVIPKEIRNNINLEKDDEIKIFIENNKIIFNKGVGSFVR